MNEANTKKFADEFCNMVQSLMIQFECIGNWKWGNPAGQTEPLPTYELITSSGYKVWCSIDEYVNAGTGVPNRKGILATFPVNKQQSLGSVMSSMVPYKFSRIFNTRAYTNNDEVEIRKVIHLFLFYCIWYPQKEIHLKGLGKSREALFFLFHGKKIEHMGRKHICPGDVCLFYFFIILASS